MRSLLACSKLQKPTILRGGGLLRLLAEWELIVPAFTLYVFHFDAFRYCC